MTNNLKAVVYGRLEAIANAEKITRVELASLSRELLMYVPESNDIDVVNRLLGVLTPVNKKAAIIFFKHFLPWDAEYDKDEVFNRFGKKHKSDKRVARKMTNISGFLAEETNTIWTWAKDNINLQKTVDGATILDKALDRALNGIETKQQKAEPMTKQQIVDVILGKISADDMLEAMTVAQARMDEMLKDMEAEEA